ncbi:MAG: hypothetical protein K2M97_08190 [Muribaculaceae bacterium]|nr:hypothetical protein [Muribaculaceae bacterium]
MKKYILMLAVASTAALFACGGNKEANTEAEVPAEEIVAVEEVAEETCCNDSAACCNDSAACCADSTVVAE